MDTTALLWTTLFPYQRSVLHKSSYRIEWNLWKDELTTHRQFFWIKLLGTKFFHQCRGVWIHILQKYRKNFWIFVDGTWTSSPGRNLKQSQGNCQEAQDHVDTLWTTLVSTKCHKALHETEKNGPESRLSYASGTIDMVHKEHKARWIRLNAGRIQRNATHLGTIWDSRKLSNFSVL